MEEVERIDNEHSFSKMGEEEISSWISEALGRPSDFGYSGDNDELFETWSLGPTIETRDSSLREKANAKAITETLEADPSLEGDWGIVSCNHWAVGWVDHLSFRVVDEGGKPSRIARVLKGLFDSLEEYSVLDEAALSKMETEATLKNIGNHSEWSKLRDDLPDDWPGKMHEWFWDNDQGAVEPSDGDGGYPSDKQFETAARALGFWDTSDDEAADD